jgi:rod shape determining protein RodA
MTVAGWFIIYGASSEFDAATIFNPAGRMGSQLVWIGVAFVITFILLMLDKNMFETFAYLAYAVVFLLLLLAVFFAPDIKGSRSWLILGSLHIQPAELAKYATALALAKCMNHYGFSISNARHFAIAAALIVAPMLCIMMQKETGSALVFLAFLPALYREGMSGYVLLAGICAVSISVIELKLGDARIGITPLSELIILSVVLAVVVLTTLLLRRNRITTQILLYTSLGVFLTGGVVSFFMPVNFVFVSLAALTLTGGYLVFLSMRNLSGGYLLICVVALLAIGFMYSVDYVFDDMLEYHQQMRIKVALGLEDDPSGAGYNVNQSKIAIGSGGFTGKGFLHGTQTKLKYVPEQDTDFIFCTVGEEFGFVGSLLVLALFATLILRLIFLSERQDSAFGRVYGYSVASIFFFHLLVNVGMVLGLMPVIGIPLPFYSYGGSSLLGFTFLLITLLRIDAGRKLKKERK